MEWFTVALAVSCTLLKREHLRWKLHFKDKELEAAVEKMMIDKGSGFSAFAPSEFLYI